MAFNGSGVFSRLYNWVTDRDAGVKILATKMDAEDDGFATAINSIVNGTQGFIGPVRGTNGTAAAPALAFTDDTDSGLYRIGANNLGVAVNGSEVLDVSTGGLEVTGAVTGSAVQSSATDATAGRLLTVGAFGVGAAGPAITDLTVALDPGSYSFVESTATGSPGTAAFHCHLEVKSNVAGVSFYAKRVSDTSPAEWVGTRYTSTGAITWKEVFNQSSVVGTVSGTSTAPAGALFESGSTSDGNYKLDADLNLECTHTLTSTETGLKTWNLPFPFSAVHSFHAEPITGAQPRMTNTGSIFTTAVGFAAFTEAGTQVAISCSLKATGKASIT